MQVPVKEREKLLKKEGLDPTRLANLTLVYKVQEVSSAGFASLLLRLVEPCGATSALRTLTELHSKSAHEHQPSSCQMLDRHEPVCKMRTEHSALVRHLHGVRQQECCGDAVPGLRQTLASELAVL